MPNEPVTGVELLHELLAERFPDWKGVLNEKARTRLAQNAAPAAPVLDELAQRRERRQAERRQVLADLPDRYHRGPTGQHA